MQKISVSSHPIHQLLRSRWSPRSFSPQLIEEEKVLSLFEAARWAPSGGNLQPWAFVLTTLGTEPHRRFVEILSGNNQRWAKNAPLLVLSLALRERKDGAPNPWALYDLGQAVANLTVQATHLCLSVRQMGGFDKARARELFEVPGDYDPVTAIAIGYQGRPDDLPEDLREREKTERTRIPLSEFVFVNNMREPGQIVDSSHPAIKSPG